MSTVAERAAAMERLAALDPDERRRMVLERFRAVARAAGLDPTRIVSVADHLDTGMEGRMLVQWDSDPPFSPKERQRFEAVLEAVNRAAGGRPMISNIGQVPS